MDEPAPSPEAQMVCIMLCGGGIAWIRDELQKFYEQKGKRPEYITVSPILFKSIMVELSDAVRWTFDAPDDSGIIPIPTYLSFDGIKLLQDSRCRELLRLS